MTRVIGVLDGSHVIDIGRVRVVRLIELIQLQTIIRCFVAVSQQVEHCFGEFDI